MNTALLEEKMTVGVPYLTPHDMKNLPQDIIDKLELPTTDKADMCVIRAIDAVGGKADISKIMIAIYHLTGQMDTRQAVSNRVNRICNKGLLVRTGKGVYTTDLTQAGKEMVEEEMAEDAEIGENFASISPIETDANFGHNGVDSETFGNKEYTDEQSLSPVAVQGEPNWPQDYH